MDDNLKFYEYFKSPVSGVAPLLLVNLLDSISEHLCSTPSA
jgi:hypothetical protein